MGPHSGDWAYLIRRSYDFSPNESGPAPAFRRATDALTFVPLDARAGDARSVVVARFRSALGNGIAPTNRLEDQFSPDGSRVVLSAATTDPRSGREHLALFLLELATGRAQQLTDDPAYHDDTPAWSPDGTLIAFSRRSTDDGGERGIWVAVPEPGRNLRGAFAPVPAGGGRVLVLSWTPDSRFIGFSFGGRYQFVEQAQIPGMPCMNCAPPSTPSFVGFVPPTRDLADWRHSSPAFVGAFAESAAAGGRHTLEISGGPGQPQAVISSDPGGATTTFTSFTRPQWRPGRDEVLALLESAPPGPGGVYEAHLSVVTAAGARRDVVRSFVPLYFEWTPSGDEIARVEAHGVGIALRVTNADGASERVIYTEGGAPEVMVDTIDLGTARL